jgi:hypothetical protein
MSKRITLPASPHLDHLRKQAKDLLSAHRRGDLDACQRIAENLPRLSATLPEEAPEKQVTLQEVHHVIAQEYGYLNWAGRSARMPNLVCGTADKRRPCKLGGCTQ